MPVTRLPIRYNPNYHRNGLKSYLYTCNKYNITPKHNKLITRNAQQKLVKQSSDGTAHEVSANDLQNDSLYTVAVQIGTPAQTLDLVSSSLSIYDYY